MNAKPFALAAMPLVVSGRKVHLDLNMNCISSNLITLWVCVYVCMFWGWRCEGLTNLRVRREGKVASVAYCWMLTFCIKISIMSHWKISDTSRGEMLHFYLLTMKHLIMDSSRIRHLFLPANNSHVPNFPL